jgi:hypothetical protein
MQTREEYLQWVDSEKQALADLFLDLCADGDVTAPATFADQITPFIPGIAYADTTKRYPQLWEAMEGVIDLGNAPSLKEICALLVDVAYRQDRSTEAMEILKRMAYVFADKEM